MSQAEKPENKNLQKNFMRLQLGRLGQGLSNSGIEVEEAQEILHHLIKEAHLHGWNEDQFSSAIDQELEKTKKKGD